MNIPFDTISHRHQKNQTYQGKINYFEKPRSLKNIVTIEKSDLIKSRKIVNQRFGHDFEISKNFDNVFEEIYSKE